MRSINHSDGFPNWTQLRNIESPLTECNVTAAINSLQCCHWDVMALRKSTDPNRRPPDDLYRYLQTDAEVLAMRDRVCQAAGIDLKTPPNELMEVLAFGIGKWIRSPLCVRWKPSYPIAMILAHVLSGGCGILHGRYPDPDAHLGYIDHMNALVGVDYSEEPPSQTLDAFIVDDSYGNYRRLYADHLGNDIVMPLADITKYIKPLGAKETKDIILIYPPVGKGVSK